MNNTDQKKLGAYYTNQLVAEYLVKWAIRDKGDRILDPSCGDGVFLKAATRYMKTSSVANPRNVYGIDIQEAVITNLVGESIQSENLVRSDFFYITPEEFGPFEVIVGNPPFIRYQTFNGASREKALKICWKLGVLLPKLASSWAPFLVHATRFLTNGGRLAVVIPAEINHASYALPVLQYIIDQFRNITIIAFREHLFPNLSQDVFCLLAEGKGENCKLFSLIITDNAKSLNTIDLNNATAINIRAIRTGEHRLIEYLISDEARTLYHNLTLTPHVSRFGMLADVGIGYVTGNNEFFHLSSSELKLYDIPDKFLKPALRSAKQLKGIKFSYEDWKESEDKNDKVWLLHIPPDVKNLPIGLIKYLNHGMELDIHKAYKCRIRKPWYSVPHVYFGDAFLSYMSGKNARLVANKAGVVATNTLHLVKLHSSTVVRPDELSALWYTSLTMLSCEIEGHAMGGGMLKLEPSEAEQVVIAYPNAVPTFEEGDFLDAKLRTGGNGDVLDYNDEVVLGKRIGLNKRERLALREGYEQLKYWRMR